LALAIRTVSAGMGLSSAAAWPASFRRSGCAATPVCACAFEKAAPASLAALSRRRSRLATGIRPLSGDPLPINGSEPARSSTASCSASNSDGDSASSLRLRAEKTLSADWQMDSMRAMLTARAAPFRLWAPRKIVSMILTRSCGPSAFSSCIRPDESAWICSAASTLNVASSLLWNSCSLLSIV
jgi:hypothetical protein